MTAMTWRYFSARLPGYVIWATGWPGCTLFYCFNKYKMRFAFLFPLSLSLSLSLSHSVSSFSLFATRATLYRHRHSLPQSQAQLVSLERGQRGLIVGKSP